MRVSAALYGFLLLFTLTSGKVLEQKGNNDTVTINRQLANAYAQARRNPDMSIMIAHKLLDASQAMSYKKGIADASLVLGMAYLAKYNKGDSALFYNEMALSTYEEMFDIRGQARACYGLAYVYSFKSDYATSEKYAIRALVLFEQANDNRGRINSLNVLNYLARQQQDIDKARNYVENAVAIAKEIKDTIPLADALNNLGNIYTQMAMFSKAIDTYFEALRL